MSKVAEIIYSPPERCEKCGSDDFWQFGHDEYGEMYIDDFRCNKCGHAWTIVYNSKKRGKHA